MKNKNLALRLIIGAVMVLLLAGCGTSTAQPTLDIQPTLIAVQTQAVKTAIAGLTQNAPTQAPTSLPSATQKPTATTALLPSATLAPTPTALPTATKTATTIPWPPTATTQPSWGCELTGYSPPWNGLISLDTDFTARWVITNIGRNSLPTSDVDILYYSGKAMQKEVNGLDLESNVDPGQSFTVSVEMHSPDEAGIYSTTWIVVHNSDVLCTMTVRINVK